MAELQFQNPSAPTAQLESELTGLASDSLTEIRREAVFAPQTDSLLRELIDEVKLLRQFLEDTTR